MSQDHLESTLEALDSLLDPPREGRPGPSCSEAVLVVHCSMSQHGAIGAEWSLDPSWTVVEVPTLGAQTWERHDGEQVLDGSLAQLTAERDVPAVLVVGHTACDVVRDAYERCVGSADGPPGIAARLRPLVSVVEDAFDEGVIDESTQAQTARCRLVEYSVVRQVAFLREAVSDSTAVAGYVHDQNGIYSAFPDKRYLVVTNGDAEPADVAVHLPEDAPGRVASLLR